MQGCTYYYNTKRTYWGEFSDNFTSGLNTLELNVKCFVDNHQVAITVFVGCVVVGGVVALAIMAPEATLAIALSP